MTSDLSVLFVTTVPLVPTNDGVRIPAANHFYALRESFATDLLLLDGFDMGATEEEIALARNLADRVGIVEMRRRPLFVAAIREMILREPVYGAFDYEDLPEWLIESEYDLVWCATPSAVAMVSRESMRLQVKGRKYVAGLSDMHSLVVWRKAHEAGKSISVTYKIVSRLGLFARSLLLRWAEKHVLSKFDLITMQTRKEYDWVSLHFGDVIERALVLPNGVADDLFKIGLSRKLPSLVFVGAVNGVYEQRIRWFIQNVWINVKKSVQNVEMHIVGKGASNDLMRFFEANNVLYTPFVECLDDVYRRHFVLVAPIFKGFGLINKVVEAMAAGCLVVGDATAFNGIDGFKDGIHGRVAQDADQFIAQICNVLGSADYCFEERAAASELIANQFRWRDRYTLIQAKVEELIRR